MSKLDSLHEYLVNEQSFKLTGKTDIQLEYKSKSLLLKINKDMSDFKIFSLDGKKDVYSIKERVITYLKNPMGLLIALLEECLELDFAERDNQLDADGFDDEVDVLEEIGDLPKCACDEERSLIIYVWGRKKRKYLHHKVDHNFNGAVLYGKKAGTDWSKDGRTEAIRNAVMKCPIFNDFLETMIKTIEKKDASKIGINCRAGRHRSVTLAWILREHYYPNAKIHLLEIK
jgi:hypothetical protein